MIGSMLVGLTILGNVLVVKFLQYYFLKSAPIMPWHNNNNNNNKLNTKEEIEALARMSNQFFKIVDSKYIGLIIFSLANLFTGCFQLFILSNFNIFFTDTKAIFTLSTHAFLTCFIAFLIYRKYF